METLAKGSLAYYDSMQGLMKCKVVSIRPGSVRSIDVEVVLTTDKHQGYEKGVPFVTSTLHVFPRKAVRVRARTFTVSPFLVEDSPVP